MAQLTLNVFGRLPLSYQQRRIGVSQVMESNTSYPGRFQDTMEFNFTHRVRVERVAVLAAEDQVQIVVSPLLFISFCASYKSISLSQTVLARSIGRIDRSDLG